MLQRAANNAYSWWWAGHIRTKQSKWLEQNLQDMEDKVQYVLSLIQEDGDTFAKRAEMYYKKRPELIFFVEDSYRAYKALADRYDHLSSEMQNANNTLATCFPEQFQLPMDDEDDYGTKTPRIPPSPNASKVPKLSEDLKGLVQKRSMELHNKKLSNELDLRVAKSGLSKSEAIEEIDRLQKDILGLQTVKEYVKSTYQSGLEKYWSIETTIMDKQHRVCNLQDEFDIDKVIEDDNARRLMAEAALKSCRETLTELQQTQQKYVRETKEEREKIEYAGQRIKHIREQYLHEHTDCDEKISYENNDSIRTGDMTPSSCIDLNDLIPDKIKQQFDISSMSSITVTELAEKIDELVSKMINLQSSVSSQTSLIDRLTSESNELHEHIRTLEDDKANLTEGTHDLKKRVKELQEELTEVQDLNRSIESLNSKLESRYAEARSSLDHISGRLSNVKADEEHTTSNPEDDGNSLEEMVNQKHPASEDKENAVLSKIEDAIDDNTHDDDLKWPMMLLDGEEDKEKLLIREYTIILKNYKAVKRKLNSIEKKTKNEEVEQITELRVSIAKRDEAIQYLRHKLLALQRKLADTMKTNEDKSSTLSPSGDQQIGAVTHEESIASCTTEEDNYLKFLLSDHNVGMSLVEEKLRRDIDTIQDESLDFWLRFSTSFQQIKKFKTMVEDLQGEVSIIKRQQENKASHSIKSEVRPIYIHLKEIEAELKAWLKQSMQLKHEVERRSTCLCDIQEKIGNALKEGIEGDEIKFSSHQAAKFQGEILHMKQENNKVSEELQAGDEHITSVQVEVDRTLAMLNDEFGLSSSNKSLERRPSRSRIPLRTFIFGAKLKKQKSIVSLMHPNKKYRVLRAGLPL